MLVHSFVTTIELARIALSVIAMVLTTSPHICPCSRSLRRIKVYIQVFLFVFEQEISFGVIDTRDTGLLHASERLLSNIFLPALAKTGNWGELSTKHGQQIRQEFINQLQNFVSVLIAAQDSLDDTVVLKECETLDLNQITTPTDYINAANSSDTLPKIEELIGIWIKQIEQVSLIFKSSLIPSIFSSVSAALYFQRHDLPE